MAINELPEIIPDPGSKFLGGERRGITKRKRTERGTGKEERQQPLRSPLSLRSLRYLPSPPEIRPFFANKESGPCNK